MAMGEAGETRLGFEMSHASQFLGLEDLVYPRTCAVQVASSFHVPLWRDASSSASRARRVLKLETRTAPRDVARTLLSLRSGVDVSAQLFLLVRLLLSQSHLSRGEKREVLLDWCARNFAVSRPLFLERLAKTLFGVLRAPELTSPAFSPIERHEVGFALPQRELELYARPLLFHATTSITADIRPLPLSLSSLNLDSLAEVAVMDAYTHIFILANDRHSHAFQRAEEWAVEQQTTRASNVGGVHIRRLFHATMRQATGGAVFINPRNEDEVAWREFHHFLYDDDCNEFASSGASGTGEFFRNFSDFIEFVRRRAGGT